MKMVYPEKASVIRTKFLPFADCCWISSTNLVAVGFDCNPMLFTVKGNTLEFTGKCDEAEKATGGGQLSGRAMFQAMDRMGTGQSSETLKTMHKVIIFLGRTIKRVMFCRNGDKDPNFCIWI